MRLLFVVLLCLLLVPAVSARTIINQSYDSAPLQNWTHYTGSQTGGAPVPDIHVSSGVLNLSMEQTGGAGKYVTVSSAENLSLGFEGITIRVLQTLDTGIGTDATRVRFGFMTDWDQLGNTTGSLANTVGESDDNIVVSTETGGASRNTYLFSEVGASRNTLAGAIDISGDYSKARDIELWINGSHVSFIYDGTVEYNNTHTCTICNSGKVVMEFQADSTSPVNMTYDNVVVFNGTPDVSVDVVGAIPLLFNVTLTSSVKNFLLNGSVSAPTNDTTPTAVFNSSEDSDCRVDIFDRNYTDMTSSNDCAGGQGTTEHTCTLPVGSAFSFGNNQSIFYSCVNVDNVDNQTLSSTSGNLQLDILSRPSVNVTILNTTIYSWQSVYGVGNYSSFNDFTEQDSTVKWFKNGVLSTTYSYNDISLDVKYPFPNYEWGDQIIFSYSGGHDYGCCVAYSLFDNSSALTIADEPPNYPEVLYPTSWLNLSVSTVMFNVSAHDNDTKSNLTFQFFVNGELNSTSSSNITVPVEDGFYNFSVSVKDNSSGWSVNSTSVNFTVDTTSPVNSFVNVSSADALTTDSVVFWYNSSDALTGVEYCYFHVFSDFDSGVTADYNVSAGVSCLTSFVFNASGNWSVRGAWAFDYANNSVFNTSTVFNVNVTEFSSGGLVVGECPDTVGGVLLVGLLLFVAFFFIVLSVVYDFGVIGLISSALVLVSSWYLVGCISVFGYAMALLGGFLMLVFGFRLFMGFMGGDGL